MPKSKCCGASIKTITVCDMCGKVINNMSKWEEEKLGEFKLKLHIVGEIENKIRDWRRGMSMRGKDVDIIEKANTQIQLVKDKLINNIKNI